jgi:hypothetical protein
VIAKEVPNEAKGSGRGKNREKVVSEERSQEKGFKL